MYDIEYQDVGMIEVLENEEQYHHAKAHHPFLEVGIVRGEGKTIEGRLVDREMLRSMEPCLTSEGNHLFGGILYPACATVHPRKVMLALALEARKNGVKICIESEIMSIQRNEASQSTPDSMGRWACTTRWLPDRLKEPVYRSDCIIYAEEVVIAAGAMTDHVVSLVKNQNHEDQGGSHQMYRILDGKARSAVIPCVGQMFQASSLSSTSSCKLHHLITGYESHMFWRTNATYPPSVTHNHTSGERYCHHLYGKQTKEGRLIFGGDRYVHPAMHPRMAHPLPRVMDKLHKGPYQHASRLLPCINDMSLTSKWGGIMPFSADGEPIIGELSSTTIKSENKTRVGSGLYIISGLGGSGMMRGAMGGYLLAQSIAGNEKEKVMAKHILAHVTPNRFWVD